MKLIVGLGNPGPQYESTRHNVGFLVLDAYLAERRFRAGSPQRGYVSASSKVAGEDRWFLKPLTFVNRSGRAVARFAAEQQTSPDDTLVVYDEADLEPGRAKLKKGGGTAGHNGLESILTTWGTDDFYRLRLGIGKPAAGELSDYVLEPVSDDVLAPIIEKGVWALDLILRLGPTKAMGEINRAE